MTRQSFLSSLVEKVAEAESIKSYEAPSFVKIASIDVEVGAVHEILLRLREEDRLSSFFDSALKGSDIHDVLSSNGTDHTNAEGLGFVSATHVTLAHCRQMSQSELRSKFTPHLGCEIELLVSGLLWNERVMALAVTVAETTKNGEALPAAQNSFVHITVWHEKGASPIEANDLPRLLEAMEAQRIEFESPIPLVGIVSLWNT